MYDEDPIYEKLKSEDEEEEERAQQKTWPPLDVMEKFFEITMSPQCAEFVKVTTIKIEDENKNATSENAKEM